MSWDDLKKKLISALIIAATAFFGALFGKSSVSDPVVKIEAPPGVIVNVK